MNALSNPSGFSTGARGGTVELRGLTKLYGAERVVDDVNVTIRSGEFFSLLGPSGSGKSTTLMMIAGFAEVDGGGVIVDGTDLAKVSPQRRGFGLVFQNYAIFPHLNVFENVAFPLRARGWQQAAVKAKVDEALRLVRLERFAEKYSRQLSGGQQQRVAIARAIVFDPAVILMDEPLGALDKNLRFEMQTEIKEIQQRLGMTVIYVTHDQEEAMTMSDRLAIMNRGRIVQVGEPHKVYERPQSLFAGRFLGEANLLDGKAEAAGDGQARFTTADGHTLRAVSEGRADLPAAPILFVRPEKISLAPTRSRQPTAETDNHVAGRVERRVFLGNTLRYTVLAGTTRFMVDVANGGRAAPVEAGTQVDLHWPVEHTLLLPGEAG